MVNSWKILLPTIVIFGAGILAGGFVTNRIDRCKAGTSKSAVAAVVTNTASTQRREPAGMDQRRIDFMRNVSSNLNLSAEQRVSVDSTLLEGQERIRKLWDDFNPKTRDVLNNVRSKIVAQLTPEQKVQFDELMKRPARKPEESSTNRPPREIKRPATNTVVQTNDVLLLRSPTP